MAQLEKEPSIYDTSDIGPIDTSNPKLSDDSE